MSQNSKDLFLTYDIFLSSTLACLGFDIEALDKSNSYKVEFCFLRTPDLDSAIQAFWAKQLKVEPQCLFANLKALKNRIYSH